MTTTLKHLSILLRLRLILLLRAPSGRPGRFDFVNKRLIALGVVLVFACLGAFALGNRLQTFAASPSVRAVLGATFIGLAPAAFVLFFVGAIPIVLPLFTFRSDLRLLLLSPISPRILIGEKILASCLTIAPFLLVLGAPTLFAIGQALGLGVGFDLLAVVIVILLPVVPVSLVVLITVGVLHWVPPARARTATTALSLALGLSAYVGSQVFFRGPVSEHLGNLLATSSHAWWSALPLVWPGQALAAAIAGDAAGALAYLAAEVLLCVVVAGLAIGVSAKLFATGWATYQEEGRRARVALAATSISPVSRGPLSQTSPTTKTTTTEHRPRWSPIIALIGKEWRVLRRDPQAWARSLCSLVGIGIGLYGIVDGSHGGMSRLASWAPA